MSPEGRPVRCRGWAMNAILDFDHIALAELIWRSPAPQSDRCGVLAQPSRNRGWAGERPLLARACAHLAKARSWARCQDGLTPRGANLLMPIRRIYA